ncbi:protein lin-54 homolog [Dendronephthya gigantea]|uniref:protein lin-54 homolog n=1 Tax=Dendronephthya gigantea TaxID=151771 RepID=UPI00106D8F9C|nr:protein lin-54 homolog [Dendronephthya gigantea]XP_028408450.1 protein lin-54 homolog [Dendronephthya gigantea]
MLQQEAASLTTLIKTEPSNGAMDATTTMPSEFVAITTATTNMTCPEPMEQDAPESVTSPQTCQAQSVQQSVASPMHATRTVSVAPLQTPGLPQGNTQPGIMQAPRSTRPTLVQTRPIARPIAPQTNKVIPAPTGTPPSNKPMYFTTTSSPNKLIAIQGGNVQRFVQGLGNLSRIQIVPQPRINSQTALRPIAPRLATSTNTTMRPQVAQIQLKPAAPRAGKQVLSNTSQAATGVVQQRVLLQAHPGPTQLRAIAPNLGNLPHGATIQFPPGTMFRDGVVYVPQQVQTGASTSGVQLSTVQIAPTATSTSQTVNGVQDPPSPSRQRKPCNCTKSQCLKLYCDCFANGEFCSNCNCNNCSNNIEHEQERSKAIKACLERNPHAFHPKIGKGKGETERRHNKGCHCKRSGCLKNYCECYEAKILCTSICKCTGCKNFEESPERKTLMHLADAAEVRVQQQNAAKTKLESQMEDMPSRAPILAHAGEKLPFSFVTRDVVEATCRCLLVQASAAEKKNISRTDIQKLVLEEFGNCLLKIIHTANNRSGS